VVNATDGNPRRSRRKRPTNPAAKCCESVALPPLPHNRILLPAKTIWVISMAVLSRMGRSARKLSIIERWSAIACSNICSNIGVDFNKYDMASTLCDARHGALEPGLSSLLSSSLLSYSQRGAYKALVLGIDWSPYSKRSLRISRSRGCHLPEAAGRRIY